MRRLLRSPLSAACLLALLVAACSAPPAPPPVTAAPAAAPTVATAPTSPAPTAAPAPPTAVPTAAPTVAPAAALAAAPTPTAAATPAAAGTVAAAAGSALSGTVKIVSSMPRSGSATSQTDSIVNAIQMCLDDARHQVGGATLVYEDLDDATAAKGTWDADQEAANATRAAADPDVLLYLGTYNSGAAKVAIPILNQAGLAMISFANSYAGLTKPGAGAPGEPDVFYPTGKRTYARVVPAGDLQGGVAAGWSKELGASRLYVLDDGDVYGKGITAAYMAAARQIGLNVIAGPQAVDPKAADYRALADTIQQQHPDLVYYAGVPQDQAGKLWQALRAAMPRVMLQGPDGLFDPAFLKDAGDAAEGTYLTFSGVPPSRLSGKGADWYQRYQQRYHAEPAAYAAYGYEACSVGLDAIRRAGKKDRAAVVDAVFATRDFRGLFGTWSFDAHGDTTFATLSGNQVQHGAFQFLKTFTVAAS